MTILKNKILTKPTKKLIFIISISMIVVLNLFGEEKIEFEYYYYTNKLYHSTLKTEIIPSEYVFITTYSNGYESVYNENRYLHESFIYENEYSYLYNLKTKEKKLYYVYNNYHYNRHYYYYDINDNLTTNWTDTNMRANGFYEITNNRFGETFYNRIDDDNYSSYNISKGNGYIQKAYKYSLTQSEIINKKDRGIYMFRENINNALYNYFSLLCLQNEYYRYFPSEDGILNYDAKGRVVFNRPIHDLSFTSATRTGRFDSSLYGEYTNTIYFKLNDKSLIKPTWNEFKNNSLDFIKKYVKNHYYYSDGTNFYYDEENIKDNLNEYKESIDVDFLGFIPIKEFEYYLK